MILFREYCVIQLNVSLSRIRNYIVQLDVYSKSLQFVRLVRWHRIELASVFALLPSVVHSLQAALLLLPEI